MDRAAGKRWLFLLCALTGTAIASFYPTEDGKVSPHARRNSSSQLAKPLASVTLQARAAALDWADTDADPFAPRGWQAPPPPPPPAPPKPIAEVAIAPGPPPGPPPLPYQFIGRLNDNAQQVVYLGRGDNAIAVKAGEMLEGTYKVLDIGASSMEVEHLSTGQKQTLTFPSHDN